MKTKLHLRTRFIIEERSLIIDWPFERMMIGDYIMFEGKNAEYMRRKAISNAGKRYHGKTERRFQSHKLMDDCYIIQRIE